MKMQSDGIREWYCQRVSETAYLVNPVIVVSERSFLLMTETKEPFWILKSDVDTVWGKAKYTIIEEF